MLSHLFFTLLAVVSVTAEKSVADPYWEDYSPPSKDCSGREFSKNCAGCRGYLDSCCTDSNCSGKYKCKEGIWSYSCDGPHSEETQLGSPQEMLEADVGAVAEGQRCEYSSFESAHVWKNAGAPPSGSCGYMCKRRLCGNNPVSYKEPKIQNGNYFICCRTASEAQDVESEVGESACGQILEPNDCDTSPIGCFWDSYEEYCLDSTSTFESRDSSAIAVKEESRTSTHFLVKCLAFVGLGGTLYGAVQFYLGKDYN